MKKIVISLLCFAFFPWYAGAGWLSFGDFTFFKDRETASPFAWSVERDGKIHYFLGTVHAGVSLERDVPCSDTILEQITNSDLVFLETAQKSIQLSREDIVIIFTGSKEEREDILNRMSPEFRQELIQRAKVTKQIVAIDPYPYRLVYEGNEGFKDLSEKAREFLTSYGADIQGNYVDYFYFIFEMSYYDALFSFDELMDLQVARIAQSNHIRIKALDDNSKIVDDLNSEAEVSQKPILPVSRADIESLVDNYSQLLEQRRQPILKTGEFYISGNGEAFQSMTLNSEEALLKNRNELWLKKFKKAHESGEYDSIFLAAGLKHFVGSFNLIDLLKEEGFSVNPIICPADAI